MGIFSDDLNLATWLPGTQPFNIFIYQPSWAEVEKLNIVTEFPCLLRLTVDILRSLNKKQYFQIRLLVLLCPTDVQILKTIQKQFDHSQKYRDIQ